MERAVPLCAVPAATGGAGCAVSIHPEWAASGQQHASTVPAHKAPKHGHLRRRRLPSLAPRRPLESLAASATLAGQQRGGVPMQLHDQGPMGRGSRLLGWQLCLRRRLVAQRQVVGDDEVAGAPLQRRDECAGERHAPWMAALRGDCQKWRSRRCIDPAACTPSAWWVHRVCAVGPSTAALLRIIGCAESLGPTGRTGEDYSDLP